jgi:hypothetical protein
MRGAIPPLPHYVFMARCLVKQGQLYLLPFRTYRKNFQIRGLQVYSGNIQRYITDIVDTESSNTDDTSIR